MKKIEFVYPNLSKKAITFTIDDGNMLTDKIFKDILEPYGFKGTFNLCSHSHTSLDRSVYREFYKGYDIANHCKYHPGVFKDNEPRKEISLEPFDKNTSDTSYIYPTEFDSELYHISDRNGQRWGKITSAEHYVELVDAGKAELEEIFARDNIRDFVWPGGQQKSAYVEKYLTARYRSVRKASATRDTTNFDFPEDLHHWSYNATHADLIEVMEKFESYPDDNKLKLYALGVHSADFEKFEKWDDLRQFARRFGNRQSEFWYASVSDIFDYALAMKSLKISGTEITNPSDITLFIKVDGRVLEITANETVAI